VAARRGRLIVIAGPSGVGKGSVVRDLLERDPHGLALSVSATTRAPRKGESNGVHYLFVLDEVFDRMIADGDLLEWAPVVGHRSGTPRKAVEELLDAGSDVILEIDVQGAEQIRRLEPDALLVFLAPPTMEELERRLRGRGTETEERIAARLATAEWEMGQQGWFDHVVVNDELERASSQVAAIIEASRSARPDAPEDPSER
jgi:guanylate kinase